MLKYVCVNVRVCTLEKGRERDRERGERGGVGVGMPAPNTGVFSQTGVTSCWLNGDACHPSLIKINCKSPCLPQEGLLNVPSGACRGHLAMS